MTATYRIQLVPEFGFAALQDLLPYLVDLGISHLYLSPITEARSGSNHGYDVIDHNQIRTELGGPEAFESLRQAAVKAGLELILDFVPNHAGVGPHNVYWQDVLAYGPSSPYSKFFDINWNPIKQNLRGKILLPFLGRPYGEALDAGELTLAYQEEGLWVHYFDQRFALAPHTYGLILEQLLVNFERSDAYWDLKDLANTYQQVLPGERDRALALAHRLAGFWALHDPSESLTKLLPSVIHQILEAQFFRLAYWKVAGDEVNYRRFFDINELVALRMEDPEVFFTSHRLLANLLSRDGVAGVRIDHIDGLFAPEEYLERLASLGARAIWVEKILAAEEHLPASWPVAGTTGYEFMNDVLGILLDAGGARELAEFYQRFTANFAPYPEIVHASKRLAMNTTLASELARLAGALDQISDSDYHTRDFTLKALEEALAELVAAMDRYRTYLPHDPDEAARVLRAAAARAKAENPASETSAYDFIVNTLLDPKAGQDPALSELIGRFQQYCAPVAAKGVEDTAFYRYVPLAALSEVGGEPDQLGLALEDFHSHQAKRCENHPKNLLATATHDHKRGEDTRMRLLGLAELAGPFQETVKSLENLAAGIPKPSNRARYLCYQLLLALWPGEKPERLQDRLTAYMLKAVREAKEFTSWLNPNQRYERTLETFIAQLVAHPELATTIAPLAQDLVRLGFKNSLTQTVLKITSPGVPDFYQGSELFDLSLVDPDNRQPVDYALRQQLLTEVKEAGSEDFAAWQKNSDPRAKLFIVSKLLACRSQHPGIFAGPYLPLISTGPAAEALLGYLRQSPEGTLIVALTRFPGRLEALGGAGDSFFELPAACSELMYQEVLSQREISLSDTLYPASLPFGFGVLFGKPKIESYDSQI